MSGLKSRSSGFSLIELILVILLLAILAAGTTRFITDSIDGYQDTARRESLASSGRIAIEKVVREVRNGHPSSIRVLAGGNCLQLLPILASGSYQDQALSYGATYSVPLPLPVTTPGSGFDVFAATIPASGVAYVMVGSGDPYPLTNPGPMATYSGIDTTATLPPGIQRLQITSHRFSDQSPARRFYLLGGPIGFCVQGGNLYRHSGFALNEAAPWDLATTGSLLAETIGNAAPYFTYAGATTSRNALLGIDFTMSSGGEQVDLRHEVQIRNVP